MKVGPERLPSHRLGYLSARSPLRIARAGERSWRRAGNFESLSADTASSVLPLYHFSRVWRKYWVFVEQAGEVNQVRTRGKKNYTMISLAKKGRGISKDNYILVFITDPVHDVPDQHRSELWDQHPLDP